MDLDKGAGLKLDITKIPWNLHYLVPYIEKWGFESLDDQDAFVIEMQSKRPQQIQEFNGVMDEAAPLIAEWGATLSQLEKHLSELTEVDLKHPYWSFLHVLKLRETTGYNDDDNPDVIAANERFAQEVRMQQYDNAVVKADEAFRLRDYATYVLILQPFKDLLSPVQKKKYELAMQRMQE